MQKLYINHAENIYSLLAHNVSLIKIGAEYSISSTSIKITFNTSMYVYITQQQDFTVIGTR